MQEAFDYVKSTGLNYAPTKNEFIFGCLKETFDHPNNYLSLLLKKFIWATKFKTANLSIVGLKGFLKMCLRELKEIYDLKDKAFMFNKWINLYSDLCREEDARNPLQAPDQVPDPLQSAIVHDLLLSAT